MNTDNEIFEEALADINTCNLDTSKIESRLLLGVRIVRDNDSQEVVIQDTSRSSFYKKVSDEEYKVFVNEGWKLGVRKVFEVRFERRLGKLHSRRDIEAQSKNRSRVIGAIDREVSNLYYRRIELLNKYGLEI